jgi:dTDP-4-dehydrorhamnose 3,5-epimerase
LRFNETKIPGVFEIEIEPRPDERGFFARSWCQQEFAGKGLNTKLVQCNVSFNTRKGTLRGMHYQVAPHGETKLVRCTRGAIYDVVVDLRPSSPTFKAWIGAVLTDTNHKMMHVPEDCAHGFLTLKDETEVAYQMSELYDAEASRGVRWDDPAFQIVWPGMVEVISDRDRVYPNFVGSK